MRESTNQTGMQERKSRWPWITDEQFPDRLFACEVGLPRICWHKICRRSTRCAAKDFSCLDDHEGYVRRWVKADRRKKGMGFDPDDDEDVEDLL